MPLSSKICFIFRNNLYLAFNQKHKIMKNILFIIISVIILIQVKAQDKHLNVLPLVDGKITYTDVVKVDSVSKDELYNRAKRWFVDNYNSSKDVIQLDDKENGEIIAKGFFEEFWQVTAYSGMNVNVWQKIQIQIKDGRYKYEITDFRIKYFVSASQYTAATNIDNSLEEWNIKRVKNCQRILVKIDDYIKSLILSLDLAMKIESDDSW